MTGKWRMTRREILRGTGVGIGLPLLDAMGTTARAAEPAAPPVRMAFVFVPNGVNVAAWTPTGEGNDWHLSSSLQPLAKVKEDVIVLGGLRQRAAEAGAGDHARSAAAFLTGIRPYKTNGADIKAGVSVDQFAARLVGRRTRLPSLELGLDKPHTAGNCDAGYSCAYATNISWSSETTPAPKEYDPGAVFDRLFGAPGAAAAERLHARKSVLDYEADDARRLDQRLGRADRSKLDEFVTSVREVERRTEAARLAAANGRDAATPPAGVGRPAGIPAGLNDHMRLMFDLLALAFRMDLTRVATVMVAREGSNRTFPDLGVTDGHHTLSHHGKNAQKLAALAKIDRFHVAQYAYLVEKLKAAPEGEGSVLDNSMVLFGCGISDGDSHSHNNLPVVLAGRGRGTIKTGRHVVAPGKPGVPMCNLYLSMLHRMGAKADGFGDSTGPLTALDG